MSVHKWQFAPRFRRNAFGWRSDTPIRRIKEALTEIRQVARKDPILAAEGAILLLEKLSPALMNVDSSSGSLGSAVNRAIETLVPVIVKPDVPPATRRGWLDRLWKAIQEDEMAYIEYLGDFWGELCVEPQVASVWADQLLPIVEHIWSPAESGHGYFKGTDACLSALHAAGRHDELLALVAKARYKSWHTRRWGVKALAAMGKKAEALRYAEQSRGLNEPDWAIAQECEAVLLSSGMMDEAYRRYALQANQGATNLATFRAIAKKYPHKPAREILRDLVISQPGAEGKWFAAAKEAGLFDLAIELVAHSPTDPRTLIRAARDFAAEQPQFAVAAGMAALRWMAAGHGYEIIGLDVLAAFDAVMQAAQAAGIDGQEIKEQVRTLIDNHPVNRAFFQEVLSPHLAD